MNRRSAPDRRHHRLVVMVSEKELEAYGRAYESSGLESRAEWVRQQLNESLGLKVKARRWPRMLLRRDE